MCAARVRALTAAELLGRQVSPGSGGLGQERGAQQLRRVLEDGGGTSRARAVAARMGVVALVDDDAVQLATAGATASTGMGGALLGRHGAGKAYRGRRGRDLVVAVPVAPLAQQRGGLLPRALSRCAGAGRPIAWSTAFLSSWAPQVRIRSSTPRP